MPHSTAGEPLIKASGVSKVYRSSVETIWATRKVDLVGSSGEFICIYGASGSGKSTLLALLAGLDSADSGKIHVAGVNVTDADDHERAELRRSLVGVVFQNHNLIGEFTAAENVALPMEAMGVPAKRAHTEAVKQLARVGLSDLHDRRPSQMSGGQRQRVGIARALVGQRAILLADEPTGAIDSAATLEIFGLLRTLCHEGLLVVVCSHDPRCKSYADTVYEIVDGELSRRS